MKNTSRIMGLFLAILLNSCVHSEIETQAASNNKEQKTEDIHLDTAVDPIMLEEDSENILFYSQVSSYQYDDTKYEVEWSTCFFESVNKNKAVIVMHEEKFGFKNDNTTCDTWNIKSFLDQGYSVLLINRPGFGRSTGRKDFVGPLSIEAMESAVAEYSAVEGSIGKSIVGIWGFGEGTIAASLLGRKLLHIKWLMMGGGIFDLDVAFSNTKDKTFKNKLSELKKLSNSALSTRSVSYDVEGLPKQVILYHGAEDHVVPLEDIIAFEKTLSYMDIAVSLEIVEKEGHNIDSESHAKLIQHLLERVH